MFDGVKHGSYFPVTWLKGLVCVIRWGLPYFRLQSPRVSSHRLWEHIWHYRHTVDGRFIKSFLLLRGLPFRMHGFFCSLFSGRQFEGEIICGNHGWFGINNSLLCYSLSPWMWHYIRKSRESGDCQYLTGRPADSPQHPAEVWLMQG